MQTFRPGDRVVAVNTSLSGPIRPPADPGRFPFRFPDGPLRRGVVYHVHAVAPPAPGARTHGVLISGLRVMWGAYEIPWDSSRFRKVEELGHPPLQTRRPAKATATQSA